MLEFLLLLLGIVFALWFILLSYGLFVNVYSPLLDKIMNICDKLEIAFFVILKVILVTICIMLLMGK